VTLDNTGTITINTDKPSAITSTQKAWLLSGNSGTNPPTEFIGTTDAQSWVMKTDNAERARILSNGNFGIGEINPSDKLQISNGNTRIGEVVNTVGAAGYGRLLYFSGGNSFGVSNSDNTDLLYFARYNVSDDVSQLRLHIGDNNTYGSAQADAFIIGNNDGGTWYPKVTVRSDGKTSISRDGIGECCGNDATLALAELTAGGGGTGRVASVSFHNGNQYQGQLSLVADATGVGTVAGRLRLSTSGLAGLNLGIQITGGVFYGTNDSRTETRDNAGLQGNAGAQSGFYETSNPSNFPTGASSWWHLIDTRHNSPTNNYAMQLSGSFFDQRLYFRKTNDNASQPWREVVTVPDNSAGYTAEHCMDQGAAVTNLTTLTGVNTTNGFCFLTYVRGKFEGGGEIIRVTTSGTDWVININSGQNSVRGCARCFRTKQ
jgi:hypothetical protein